MSVIAAAAPLLARDEFQRVLADPADRPVVQAGQRLVLARPADRLLRGIDMGHLGAGRAPRPARRRRYSRTGSAPSPAGRRRAIGSSMKSQCAACSGKTPTWRNDRRVPVASGALVPPDQLPHESLHRYVQDLRSPIISRWLAPGKPIPPNLMSTGHRQGRARPGVICVPLAAHAAPVGTISLRATCSFRHYNPKASTCLFLLRPTQATPPMHTRRRLLTFSATTLTHSVHGK